MPSDRNVRHVARLPPAASLQLFPTYDRPPVLRVNVAPTLIETTIPSYIVFIGAVGIGRKLQLVLSGKVITLSVNIKTSFYLSILVMNCNSYQKSQLTARILLV